MNSFVFTLFGLDPTQSPRTLQTAIQAWRAYIDRLMPQASRDAQIQHLVSIALLRLALAHALLKEWAAAFACLKQVRTLSQDRVLLLLERMLAAGMYTSTEQEEQAIACWTEVITDWKEGERGSKQFTPDLLGHLYLFRAMAYGKLAQYQQALADCDHAARLSSKEAEVWSVRGFTMAQLGDLEQAVADCAHAIALEATVRGYHRRGVVYMLREEFDKALDDFEQALALDPQDEGVRQDYLQAQTLQTFALLKTTFPKPEP